MRDIVEPKYRCKDCGYVHFFHQSCVRPWEPRRAGYLFDLHRALMRMHA